MGREGERALFCLLPRETYFPYTASANAADLLPVLPNFVFSKPLDPAHQGFPTSSGMVALLYQGADLSMHRGIPPRKTFPTGSHEKRGPLKRDLTPF